MGLFDGLKKQKVVRPNTMVKHQNNITERLMSVLNAKYPKAKVYLIESGDPKFVNIRAEDIPDVLGVITRDEKNVVKNIGLFNTRGVPQIFLPTAENDVQVYVNRELNNVPNPYEG